MRALATGDWQVSPANLTEFKHFSSWLFRLAVKEKVTHLFMMGDAKHNFNPVDLRVLISLLRCFKRFQDAGIEVIALEGNHDLLAVRGKLSWFSILKRCGVKAISIPEKLTFGDTSVYCVPFSEDKVATKKAMATFGKQATSKDVMLFHDEIAGCRYNVMSGYDGKGLHQKDLYHRRSERTSTSSGVHGHMIGERSTSENPSCYSIVIDELADVLPLIATGCSTPYYQTFVRVLLRTGRGTRSGYVPRSKRDKLFNSPLTLPGSVQKNSIRVPRCWSRRLRL